MWWPGCHVTPSTSCVASTVVVSCLSFWLAGPAPGGPGPSRKPRPAAAAAGLQGAADRLGGLAHRAQLRERHRPAEVPQAAVRRDEQPVGGDDLEPAADPLLDLLGRLHLQVL